MNGFKVLAVGAFLYCGPSFCHAQINVLDTQTGPKSILVKAVQEDAFQPAGESELTRSRSVEAEITSDEADAAFEGTNPSPSDMLIDDHKTQSPVSDPASLPVGIRHRHNPIDQILQNGLMSQTPNSAQVPVAWPSQGNYNPTAQFMSNPGCTQGLWDSYPAERAAECALMYQRLAGHQHCRACSQGCGTQGCGTQGCGAQGCGKPGCNAGCKSCGPAGCGSARCGAAHFQPVNRYAPAVCDGSHVAPAAHRTAANQPQFQSLLAPAPTLAAPLADESKSEAAKDKDNVAQLPGLFR